MLGLALSQKVSGNTGKMRFEVWPFATIGTGAEFSPFSGSPQHSGYVHWGACSKFKVGHLLNFSI